MLATKPPKELQAKWDKILRDSGFVDIEDRSSSREMLKSWHSTLFIHRFDKDRFEARQTYFHLATQFLYAYEFESELDEEIWRLHSDGLSLREIAKQTGKVSKDGAQKIIHRLQRAMKDQNTSGH